MSLFTCLLLFKQSIREKHQRLPHTYAHINEMSSNRVLVYPKYEIHKCVCVIYVKETTTTRSMTG